MWVIVRAITSILNLVVQQCVLNQTRGCELLFNVLHAALSICLKLQNEYNSQVAIVMPLMCGEFYVELEILYVRMAHKAICVLQFFLICMISLMHPWLTIC